MTVKKSFRPFAHVTLKMLNLDSVNNNIKVFVCFSIFEWHCRQSQHRCDSFLRIEHLNVSHMANGYIDGHEENAIFVNEQIGWVKKTAHPICFLFVILFPLWVLPLYSQ